MPFPNDSEGRPLSEQAILAGVAGLSGSAGVLRVSSLTEVTVALENDASVNRVSAFSNDASQFRISAFGVNIADITNTDAADLRISAFQTAPDNLRISAFSSDAGTLRMSAVGGTAGDNTIVDGTTQTISATLTPISANPAATVAGLVTHTNQPDAGRLLVSAKSNDGAQFRVSAFSNDAALLRMSAIGGTAGDNTLVDGTTQSISATLTPISANPAATVAGIVVHANQPDAGRLLVSATVRSGAYVSAVIDNGSVSAKSNDAAQFRVSAFSGDAGTMLVSATIRSGAYVSAVVDNGSVSAKSNDAAQLRISAFQGDAVNLNVSAKSSDGATFRVSALQSAVTTATGGASTFSTSAGIAQLSAIKSSSGRLYGWYLFNRAGAAQYLQVFNVSAITSVALGTDVPALTLGVPDTGAGANMAFAPGDGFSNGIVVGVTSAPNGATAGASAMVINLFYA